MWLFSIQFVPCYLIYRSSILHFLFPRNVYSRIFFFHLCGTNDFQNEKVNILYDEHRFANIFSTEVYLPNDATAISGAETSDPGGKAKTTRRKEREERVTNGSRVRSSRNSVSISLSRNFHLFHIIARFLLCSIFSYFMGAPIKVLRE